MADLRELELARLRAMTPTEKLGVANGLWHDARAMAKAAIMCRHPDWTPEQVARETRRLMSGDRA